MRERFLRRLSSFLTDYWQIILILLFSFFLRIFRVRELTTFSGDQGIDLLVVKRMLVDHRWTLLGPKTSVAPIFNGPAYYYMLLPFLTLTSLDPIGASYFMIFTYILTIFLIYIFCKKFVNKRVGILAALFFGIWPISVEYSRVSFNSFPTPLFAMIFVYSLFRSLNNYRWAVLVGLSLGVMMQLHYFNFFLGLIGLIWSAVNARKLGFYFFILFFIFFLIGFSPMIFFELRHSFFNTKSLYMFLKEGGVPRFKLQLHYFISFFPLIFIFLSLLLDKIIEKNKLIGVFICIFLFIYNVSKLDLFRNNGFTMPSSWNMNGVERVAEIIKNDLSSNENFNIAAILDGDTRGYPYRYFLEIKGVKPLGVDEYPQTRTLYVVGRGDEDFIINYPVWEIYSILPAKITKVWEIQNGVKLFKLEK